MQCVQEEDVNLQCGLKFWM